MDEVEADDAHGFDVAAAPALLDQLTDDDVVAGKLDWAGCDGCSGWLYCVEDGANVPKRPRSGVTVRKPLPVLEVLVAGLVGLCVDHENDGVLGVLELDLIVAVDDDMTDGVSSQLGMPLLDDAVKPDGFPLTRASKSSSVAPLLLSNVVPVTPPNARKSSPAAAVPLVEVPDNS